MEKGGSLDMVVQKERSMEDGGVGVHTNNSESVQWNQGSIQRSLAVRKFFPFV